MTLAHGRLRDVADAALRFAMRVMPPAQRRWVLAARYELRAIEDHGAALRWALGGLRAACMARWRSLRLLDQRSVRWSGAAVLLCCAAMVMLPALLTLGFRLQQGSFLELLARMTPGDDWHRLVPAMQALPDSVHVLLLAAGFCYLAGAVGVLRRQEAAAVAVLVGVALDLATRVIGQVFIEPAAVVVGNSSILAQVIVPLVLPLLWSFAASSGRGAESTS